MSLLFFSGPDPNTYQEVGAWETPTFIRLPPSFLVSDMGCRKPHAFAKAYVHRVDAHLGYAAAELILGQRGYKIAGSHMDGELMLVAHWERSYKRAELASAATGRGTRHGR